MHRLNRKSIWITGCVLLAACTWGCKSSRSYIERGNQLYAAGKYEDAALTYRNAIKRDSRSGEAYYRLAKALEKLNRGVEVYQNLNQAVTFSPENLPAKLELASLCLAAYLRDSRHPPVLYKQAKSLTDELLAKDANSADGLRLKGSIFLVDNQPSEAVKAFRQALRSAPASQELPPIWRRPCSKTISWKKASAPRGTPSQKALSTRLPMSCSMRSMRRMGALRMPRHC